MQKATHCHIKYLSRIVVDRQEIRMILQVKDTWCETNNYFLGTAHYQEEIRTSFSYCLCEIRYHTCALTSATKCKVEKEKWVITLTYRIVWRSLLDCFAVGLVTGSPLRSINKQGWFLIQYIAFGSIIVTYECLGYIRKSNTNVMNETVNNSKTLVNAETGYSNQATVRALVMHMVG